MKTIKKMWSILLVCGIILVPALSVSAAEREAEKIEVSFDEPLNIDVDGNELLLSDVLGTENDEIYKIIEEEIDKDLLVKGNKTYSKDTCCFIPIEINSLMVMHRSSRGAHPCGVHFRKRYTKRPYCAVISRGGAYKTLGYFATAEEAFYVYKEAKEAYIKEVANKWKDQIDVRAYNALMNYQVEITD